jgi:hypothetical protein
LDALPPILEGINFAAIDQRLEATRFERRFEPIREGHVLARIRDEDSGLRLSVVRVLAIRDHGSVPILLDRLAGVELA